MTRMRGQVYWTTAEYLWNIFSRLDRRLPDNLCMGTIRAALIFDRRTQWAEEMNGDVRWNH